MAHSFQYQITESVRVVEIEIGKLLDLAAMLKDAGNDALATAVSSQANKLLEAAVALRIAMAGLELFAQARICNGGFLPVKCNLHYIRQ